MAGDLARSSVLIVLMKLISPLDGGMWLAVVEFSAVLEIDTADSLLDILLSLLPSFSIIGYYLRRISLRISF